MIITFTPLLGETELYQSFARGGDPHKGFVNMTGDDIIATNNQTLVRVPCKFIGFEGLTLPSWAVKLLNRPINPHGPMPSMAVNEHMIKFTWDDGVVLQAQRFAADMPAVVFQLAEKLIEEAPDPIAQPIVDLLKEMDKLDSYHCCLTPKGLLVETRDGEQVMTDMSFNGSFKLSMDTARLVFTYATHINFADTPARLRFSKTTEPKLIGFAAGMT